MTDTRSMDTAQARMSVSGFMPAAVLQSIAGHPISREEAMNTSFKGACAIAESVEEPAVAVDVMDAMISTGDVVIF